MSKQEVIDDFKRSIDKHVFAIHEHFDRKDGTTVFTTQALILNDCKSTAMDRLTLLNNWRYTTILGDTVIYSGGFIEFSKFS